MQRTFERILENKRRSIVGFSYFFKRNLFELVTFVTSVDCLCKKTALVTNIFIFHAIGLKFETANGSYLLTID